MNYSSEKEKERQFLIGNHWCVRCCQFKHKDEFSIARSKKYGRNRYCRPCHSKMRQKTAPANKKKINRKNQYRVMYYTALCGGECQRCGYNKTSVALDFHHVNPSQKENDTGYFIRGGNQRLAYNEVDKCVLLCANCHREFEANLWTADFVKRDGIGWTIVSGTEALLRDDRPTLDVPDNYIYSQLPIPVSE